MGVRIIQVDAFTDTPFSGNPAVVCILPGTRDERWMQNVAREMNVSETAFLYRRPDGFNLRWFTPAMEGDLCGHATLATAHVLREERYLKPDQPVTFHTRGGVLTAAVKGHWIELDSPSIPESEAAGPCELPTALGATPRYFGRTGFDYLVEVDSEEVVRKMQPDFSLLATFPARATIVTSRASSAHYDIVSRVFAPRLGINEDPVTGSAHCCLGPFWTTRLRKAELVAYQASRRGGTLHLRVKGKRVYVSGKAITVLSGELSDRLNARPLPALRSVPGWTD